MMVEEQRQTIVLYAEQESRQWVVRDTQGNLWVIPPGDDGWEARQPFDCRDETKLVRVPGHYQHQLGLPR